MTYQQILGPLTLVLAMQCTAFAQEAPMPPLRPDQVAFRALYKELIETNTTLSAGSCTLLAQHIAAHLKTAGFTDKDITLFSVPDHPKEGGLVAVLAGSSTRRSLCCSWVTSMWLRPSAKIGRAILSKWLRRTAISMAAAPRT